MDIQAILEAKSRFVCLPVFFSFNYLNIYVAKALLNPENKEYEYRMM